jgi:ABC-type lipoprotein release transport system permease subunit
MTRRAGFRIAWVENMRFALGAMRAQKLRSFLTLLGVMAGVATVIMMVSFVAGFNNQVTAAFTSFGAPLVQFQKYEPRFGGPDGPPEEERNRRDLTIEDAEALKRLSKLVKAVSAERYLFENAVVKAGRNEANGPVILGAIPDYCEANVHFVQDGRFISDASTGGTTASWASSSTRADSWTAGATTTSSPSRSRRSTIISRTSRTTTATPFTSRPFRRGLKFSTR